MYVTDTTTISWYTTTINGYRNKWTLSNTIPQLLLDMETIVVDMTDAKTIIGYRNNCSLYHTIPQLLVYMETNVIYLAQYHNF